MGVVGAIVHSVCYSWEKHVYNDNQALFVIKLSLLAYAVNFGSKQSVAWATRIRRRPWNHVSMLNWIWHLEINLLIPRSS